MFGLQQGARCGWSKLLMDVKIFHSRSARVDIIVLFVAMIVFVALFFFGSEYVSVWDVGRWRRLAL